MTSSVAGLIVSNVLPLAAGTHLPPMKHCVWRILRLRAVSVMVAMSNLLGRCFELRSAVEGIQNCLEPTRALRHLSIILETSAPTRQATDGESAVMCRARPGASRRICQRRDMLCAEQFGKLTALKLRSLGEEDVGATAQQDCPGLVGLHDVGPRNPGRRGPADGRGFSAARPARASSLKFYDTLEDFYLAEALEYITPGGRPRPTSPRASAARSAPPSNCRWWPGWSTSWNLNLRHCHFWGMDEWAIDGREVARDFPLSFARADRELCFNRIRPELRMPDEPASTFPASTRRPTAAASTQARCVVMQGGQGEVKHWAFNDPPRRAGALSGPAALAGRVSQARHAPGRAAPDDDHSKRPHLGRRRGDRTCRRRPSPSGPVETWKAEKVSIWHAGNHDNPFGLRLTTLMISQADCPTPPCRCRCWPIIRNVQFNFFRGGIGTCDAEMH